MDNIIFPSKNCPTSKRLLGSGIIWRRGEVVLLKKNQFFCECGHLYPYGGAVIHLLSALGPLPANLRLRPPS